MFHLHKWGMWNEYFKTDMVKGISKGIVGYVFIQKRQCVKCGLIQYKKEVLHIND